MNQTYNLFLYVFYRKKILITFMLASFSLAAYGCLEPIKYVPQDFPNSVGEVSSIKGGADQYRCRNGEFNGKHISKIDTGSTRDYITKNPNGSGNIVKQYVCYKGSSAGPEMRGYSYYGIAFTFHTTDEGIVTGCTEDIYIYEY